MEESGQSTWAEGKVLRGLEPGIHKTHKHACVFKLHVYIYIVVIYMCTLSDCILCSPCIHWGPLTEATSMSPHSVHSPLVVQWPLCRMKFLLCLLDSFGSENRYQLIEIVLTWVLVPAAVLSRRHAPTVKLRE